MYSGFNSSTWCQTCVLSSAFILEFYFCSLTHTLSVEKANPQSISSKSRKIPPPPIAVEYYLNDEAGGRQVPKRWTQGLVLMVGFHFCLTQG